MRQLRRRVIELVVYSLRCSLPKTGCNFYNSGMAASGGRHGPGLPVTSARKVVRNLWPLVCYVALLRGLLLQLQRSHFQETLGSALPWAFASFALLLAPLWFFGFDAAAWIRNAGGPRLRILLAAGLGIPYLVFSLPTRQFRWELALAMSALPIVLAAAFELSSLPPKLTWRDGLVLALIAAIQMLKLLAGAWPYLGLGSLPKLFLIDLALYVYVVSRRLDGVGYSLIPTRATVVIGLREWLYFLPFGLGLGAALRFIHYHPFLPSILAAISAVVLTFLLVALPEEIFFRGILQNLLETRLGRRPALLLASLLFGLAHFNKGATFNWRYVVLAAVAGVFYGRAWRAQRQVLASAIAHTAVDVVWSVWFR
jgi:CAAX protease family protein